MIRCRFWRLVMPGQEAGDPMILVSVAGSVQFGRAEASQPKEIRCAILSVGGHSNRYRKFNGRPHSNISLAELQPLKILDKFSISRQSAFRGLAPFVA